MGDLNDRDTHTLQLLLARRAAHLSVTQNEHRINELGFRQRRRGGRSSSNGGILHAQAEGVAGGDDVHSPHSPQSFWKAGRRRRGYGRMPNDGRAPSGRRCVVAAEATSLSTRASEELLGVLNRADVDVRTLSATSRRTSPLCRARRATLVIVQARHGGALSASLVPDSNAGGYRSAERGSGRTCGLESSTQEGRKASFALVSMIYNHATRYPGNPDRSSPPDTK